MGQEGGRRDLFDRLEIGMMAVGMADHRVWRANAASCRILGRCETDLIGMIWERLLHPADRVEEVDPERRSTDDGGADHRGVLRFTRPDGSDAYVLATAVVCSDGPECEPYYLTQFQDVTRQIAVQHHIRLLLENTSVTLLLIDRGGCIVFPEGAVKVGGMNLAGKATISEMFQGTGMVPMAAQALAGQRVSGVIELYGRWCEVHMVPILAGQDVTSVAVVATDVTEREKALAELRVRSAEQAIVADLGRVALASLEPESLWRVAAATVADHLGADAVMVRDLCLPEFSPPLIAAIGSAPQPDSLISSALAAAGPFVVEGLAAVDGGASENGNRSGLAVPVGQPGNPTAVLSVYRDSSFSGREVEFLQAVATVLGAAAARLQAERDVRYRASHDALTGLPNRSALLDQLRGALAGSGCGGRYRTGVLFVDLDGFKTVNDSLGHQTGDHLLREVAGRLRHAVRPGDTVARLSGDEFAILCENIVCESDLEAIAERVVTTVAEPLLLDGRAVEVTASVGVASSGIGVPDAEGLLRAADIAMYSAKNQGRGRHLVFDEAMRSRIQDRLRTEKDLRRALATGEFRLHYQPIFNIHREVVGAEALLRWEHPTRGLLHPDKFVPLAEETGLIVPLGRRVLEIACRTAGGGTGRPPAVGVPQISINVSARHLTDSRFIPDLVALLGATNADGCYRLCLEIAESALIDDTGAVAATLRALHALGVILYVDAFGSGHSSLSRLHRLPLDGLKIDGRFVDGMIVDPADRAVVAAVIHLAHTLGLTAIAEGVETSEQLNALTALHCDLLQGCHLARPERRLTAW